jgi:8-oxo-dGTP pyrophosphatase MutT (NUDIX family)
MRYEESFGIIPLRQVDGAWEVFLIQHRKGGYWGFPKGHAESGETPEEAATRELKEETNLDCIRYLQSEPLTEEYQFLIGKRPVSKRVFYFIAEVGGDISLQSAEIQSGIWLPIHKALERVTHPEGKQILSSVIRGL